MDLLKQGYESDSSIESPELNTKQPNLIEEVKSEPYMPPVTAVKVDMAPTADISDLVF